MSRFIPGEKVGTITSASGTELTLRLPDIRDLDILLEFINELAETTIEQATQRIPNLHMLQLDVYSENTNAYHLYKKLGFVESGRLPGAVKYRNRFLDKVVMTRSL
jgi:hypothetical protein